MTNFVSYKSYDCHNCMLVPVIASFDDSGSIRPLYVRINGISLKVVSHSFISSLGLLSWQCNVDDNGFLKPIVLTFHPREFVWSIPIKNNPVY